MSLLSLKDVSITIKNNTVVDKINFNIETGEIVSIIGPNGAGKTVLIKAILGLQNFTGQILFDNKPAKLCLKDIGYVPQSFEFDRTFPITVLEFLNLSATLGNKKIQKQICSELFLEKLYHKKLGDLSGGQLQKVLIAHALIKEPRLLILDEPVSGVDSEGTKSFYELVSHFNSNHHTSILLISHEINMVYKFTRKVVCLNRNLVCFGDPALVLNKQTLEKLYQSNLEMHAHKH